MSETRKQVIDEVLEELRAIGARYDYHARSMDPLSAKDTVAGSIQAIKTAIRAVEKLANK